MKAVTTWLIGGLLLLAAGVLPAQTGPTSSLRDTVLAPDPAGHLLDTLTVDPASVRLYRLSTGRPLPATDYALSGRYLSWRTAPPSDSVRAVYRVFPFALGASAVLLDSSQLVREEAGLVIGGYTDYARAGLLDNNGKVRTTGSFSRAISVGNRQDLVLNSAFNLQLNGELGNGIEVAAAITDESLPVQPEGTTQQLREFDKIFIQLRKNKSVLTAGDYELRHPDGYFLRYFKKLEGATFTNTTDLPELGKRKKNTSVLPRNSPVNPSSQDTTKRDSTTTIPPAANGNLGAGAGAIGRPISQPGIARANPERPHQITSVASVAVARGQFTRQQIQPIEGNQGPYKLVGNGGQRFLIILAGTERIYLDGQLLVRGLDGDYIIDYNLAELTFTTRRLITRDSRITAEYEFSDQRYLRTLATGGVRYDRGRFSTYLNGYTQQDSRTATGDLELTTDQRAQLAAFGDRPEGVPVLAIDTLDTRAEVRATYERVDTSYVCGGVAIDTFFLRSSVAGRFVATFTERGFNGGLYEIDPDRPANERVFRFVGVDPATCLPRGNFDPVIDLVAPRQQQLLALGGEYRFATNGRVRVEGSRSKLDLNRFSREDAADDGGSALRMDLDRTLPVGPDSLGWQLATRGQYEFVESTFNAINPYRSPEFFRNWNLSNRLGTTQPVRRNEQLIGAGLGLVKTGLGRLDYDFEQFTRGADYRGQRHQGAMSLRSRTWRIDGVFSLLESSDTESTGSFRRPSLRVAKTLPALGGWEIQGAYKAEQSLRRQTVTDSLSPFSFAFERFSVGLATPANDKYRLALSANQRTDELPRDDALVVATEARELAAEGSYSAGKNVQLGGNVTFRDLDVRSAELVEDTPNRTFLGRVDLRTTALGRSLRTQTTYQVGSGQEPRVDFQYLYVGPGQGQYIWQDSLYNNDGRIQPNEMELAPFADIGDYVRVSVFTNDFIRTNNVAVNQKLNWDPARLWRKAKGVRKLLKKFALNTSVIIDRKTREDPEIQSWNPFQIGIADSSLVALNVQRRHGLFFNRANPKYDVQLSNADRRNRRVLTTGYESTQTQDWTLRFRFRPNDQLSLEAAASTGQRAADSEFFNNKDFVIDFRRVEPSINWQPGNFRLVTRLILGTELNVLPTGNGEGTERTEVEFEGNFNNWLTARFRWVDIALDGDARSPVGFALLQGLQPGRNLLWNLGATRQLGQYLQLTLSYEGRQTGVAKTVHVGRAQVQAFF